MLIELIIVAIVFYCFVRFGLLAFVRHLGKQRLQCKTCNEVFDPTKDTASFPKPVQLHAELSGHKEFRVIR